jgi:hypothetical protein
MLVNTKTVVRRPDRNYGKAPSLTARDVVGRNFMIGAAVLALHLVALKYILLPM